MPEKIKNESRKVIQAAGGIVKNKDGKIILIKLISLDTWGFPKGTIEKNEDALTAAKREILEETPAYLG